MIGIGVNKLKSILRDFNRSRSIIIPHDKRLPHFYSKLNLIHNIPKIEKRHPLIKCLYPKLK